MCNYETKRKNKEKREKRITSLDIKDRNYSGTQLFQSKKNASGESARIQFVRVISIPNDDC